MTTQAILLLREDQIPFGIQVQIVKEGTTEPLSDDEGPLPPLTCLAGGVPMRPKLYDLGSMREVIREDRDGRKITGVVMSGGMEGFKPEVRFRPLEVFTVDDASKDRELFVFVDGERITYEQLPYPQPYRYLVTVQRRADGRLISTCGYAYEVFKRPIQLPPNALLVPKGAKP